MPHISSELVLALIGWTIAWKGFALWRAAKRNDKAWYIVILLVGTAGILEALYLFLFSKEKKVPHRKSAKK